MSYFEPPILDEKYFEWRARLRHMEYMREKHQRDHSRYFTLEDDKEAFVAGKITITEFERRVEARFSL